MPVRVRVLFFGVLRDVLGSSGDELALPEGATLRDLLVRYENQVPGLKQYVPTLALSINQEYSPASAPLNDGDEIALLPPVSGGATVPSEAGIGRCLLTRRVLSTTELAESLKRPEDGAIVIFEGVVRNHSRSRRTRFLEYDAYEAMAARTMEALVAEAIEKFAIREAVIHHRLGRLEIGETSVVIVVVSAHRAPAFEACRWLIDALKRTVPIWKKEHFEDGAVWADGEPFPEDIAVKGTGESKNSV